MGRIIDITQEVFGSRVWPGDPEPVRTTVASIADGSVCNVTAFSMCAHNGTHVDAPYHFLKDGKTIEQLDLAAFAGPCHVVRHAGDVTAADAERFLQETRAERLLIAGPATVTAEAAKVFAATGLKLIGNESQTVGPENAPMEVHLILLGAGVVLLEGIVLTDVAAGEYFLNAAPLKLGGSDGAPCRAWLMEL